ncbi:MAG TPA: hypothetical protein VIQ31_14560 [Phormidium sp.]
MYRSDYCQVGDRQQLLPVTSGVGVLTENLKFATSRPPLSASSLRSSLSERAVDVCAQAQALNQTQT